MGVPIPEGGCIGAGCGVGPPHSAARIEDSAHFFLNPDEREGWEEGLARLARQACGAYAEGRFSLF